MNEDNKILSEKLETALNRREYIIEELLGKGAFGLVVKAKSTVDKQKYAIKILRRTNDDSDTNAKYQRRELELLAQCDGLRQQNIIRYHHSWREAINNIPFLFIQTELCVTNLSAFIYDNAIAGSRIVEISSPKPLWAHVFPQILNGLRALHKIGWVHRDIHPGNILIATPVPQNIQEIVVKIADFGFAREIASILEQSMPLSVAPKLPGLSPGVGHELFRAPELTTGYYDYKVDLYSAGIVLYFLSRYLPDKRQWKDEIQELRNGQRGREDLSHQDKIVFMLIYGLLDRNPQQRPTATQALKLMKGDGKKLTEKTFLVKKCGDKTYYRCTTADDSFEGLKAAIQEHCHIGIKSDAQKLQQEMTNENLLVGITCTQDVQEMFVSAEKQKKKVCIVVTDRTEEA